MKKLIVLGIAAVAVFLVPFQASAVSMDETGDPLEEYLAEQNNKGYNTIILSEEVDKQVGEEVTKELKSLFGVGLKKSKTNAGSTPGTVYQFPAMGNKSLSKVNSIISGDKKQSSRSTSSLSTSNGANSVNAYSAARACAYYHDYYWGLGRYVQLCGNNQTVNANRLSSYGWGNDDISSVYYDRNKISSILYEHDNFRGWNLTVNWDRGYLLGKYNNNASSIKVYFPGVLW